MKLEDTINREALAYACGRAITYPQCGHITDVRQAALVTYTMTSEAMVKHGVDEGTYTFLVHVKCADVDGTVEALEENDGVESFEVIDGRKL